MNQFYLAWIGVVPFFVVLNGTRSQWSAFLWSWIAGTLFFIANMWWISFVTGPGMVALMAVLALYWGVTGVVIRGAKLLAAAKYPLLRLMLIGTIWIAGAEYLRGSWPWHGLPWLYLGYTQSSALWLCQISDITGVAGLSFLIVLVNAWIAMLFLNRLSIRRLSLPGFSIAILFLANLGYGIYRFKTESLVAGPKVLVVQPNFPQSNTGEKGATQEDLINFHLNTTRAALAKYNDIDLIVWSETMMPSLNPYARLHSRGTRYGTVAEEARSSIADLAFISRSAVLAGGAYSGVLTEVNNQLIPSDNRNSAYYFDRTGVLSDLRYDKIHLVPFGEFIPFKEGFPALYRLMIRLGPPDMESYGLTAGDENQLTVFPLPSDDSTKSWKFVVPICFEDIDPDICAKMVRPEPAEPNAKRADCLVNITNDGWFKANENAQHLQAGIFRSIENRVPTARAVNTGISGFVDPLGRSAGLLPARSEGVSVQTCLLDSRITFFTRHGLIFSQICAIVAIIVALQSMSVWLVRWLNRKGVIDA